MLFNLPAFVTVQEWSKFAPSFLYSFEYSGSNVKGSHFLKGLPVVAGNNSIGDEIIIGHGDDLAYLFDVRDLHGNPINSEVNIKSKIKRINLRLQISVDITIVVNDARPMNTIMNFKIMQQNI